MAGLGTLLPAGIGRFRESESRWPLSGDESEERSVSLVPKTAIQLSPDRPLSQTPILRYLIATMRPVVASHILPRAVSGNFSPSCH